MDKTLDIVIVLGQPLIFRIDSVGAAIISAGLMIITGSISKTKAYMAIDY